MGKTIDRASKGMKKKEKHKRHFDRLVRKKAVKAAKTRKRKKEWDENADWQIRKKELMEMIRQRKVRRREEKRNARR